MTLSIKEGASLLDEFYPAYESNIHGRQHVSRLAALIPQLVEFFKENKSLVPPEYEQELDSLTSNDLENWQRVAMMRASGRNTDTGFIDKQRGHLFAAAGEVKCREYLQRQGMSPAKAAVLASAIVEAEQSGGKKSLLGWILQHATSLETVRDQLNKTFSTDKLPSWQQAQHSPSLVEKLNAFAIRHYQLIEKQQGFTCVKLTNGNGEQIYPRPPAPIHSDRGPEMQAGQAKIQASGLDSVACFEHISKDVKAHYFKVPGVSAKTASAVALPPRPISPPPSTARLSSKWATMRAELTAATSSGSMPKPSIARGFEPVSVGPLK